MSDHQQDQQHDDRPPQADRQPAWNTRDPHEPDFSRLRQARAQLDNAFPQD